MSAGLEEKARRKALAKTRRLQKRTRRPDPRARIYAAPALGPPKTGPLTSESQLPARESGQRAIGDDTMIAD